MVAEILELNEDILGVSPDNGFHEFVDEVVVFLACYALLAQTDVERIFQKALKIISIRRFVLYLHRLYLVVGANVQEYGQTLMRLYTCQGSVQG